MTIRNSSFMRVIVLTCFALIANACGSASISAQQLSIETPWVRSASAPVMESHSQEGDSSTGMTKSHSSGTNSAAYMLIRNRSDQADTLLKVECEAAEAAELHLSQTEGDVASMTMLDKIEIPARGVVELEPAGLHIMLVGIKHDLNAGNKVRLTLYFEQSGPIAVEAEVRTP